MTSKNIKGEVMSASNGGTTRRRISLLAGSSLVAATVILSAGGVALTPTAAWAINECVPIGTDPAANGTAADTFACTGPYATGITYSSAGALTVNSTGAMNVGTVGINLTGNTADSVTFTATGVVTGTAGPVIDVTSVSGPISVATAGVTGTNANVTYGIQAVSTGGGAVSVNNTAGNVNATSASGLQQSAIRAVSTGGNGAVSVTTAGNVTGRLRGIEARSSGTGALTITVNGGVAASSTVVSGVPVAVANIDATTTGTGLLTVDIVGTTGTINGASATAIRTSAGGDAVINVAEDRGVSATAAGTVLNVTATGGTTVNNAGSISNQSGLAIRAAGGAFTFNNLESASAVGASLSGRIDFTAVTGTATINNEPRATWTASGVSEFGSGMSVLNNEGRILAVTTATFTGLDTFDNSGSIEFGPAQGDSSRAGVGQVIAAPGAEYIGSGNGRLLMEAVLGTAGQSSCAAATVADCFGLVGGTTSGVTTIILTADGAITTSANTAGIVLVDVSGGTSHAGDFILDIESENYLPDAVYGAVIATDGLLGFALQYDATNQRHFLGTVVPGNRLEYLAVAQEVISVWNTTGDVVAGRQADLQNGSVGGFWVRVAADRGEYDRSAAFTASGGAFTFADDYETETTTVIGGFDLLSGQSNGGDFVFGVHGGAVKSTLERGASSTTDQMDGAVGGIYAGWWSDTLTLDGTINANFLKLDQDRTVEEVSSTNVISVGARGEAGWRIPVAAGLYVQPLVTATYVRAQLEDVIQDGYETSWEDVQSLRGAVGVRVGGDAGLGAGRLGYWLTGRTWKEFSDDGAVMLSTLAEEVVIDDQLAEEFQEISLGLSLSNSGDTLRGYVSGGAKFGGFDSYSASFGLRLRW